MTDPTAAMANLDRAQALLEQVTRDISRLDETLTWLDEARARVAELDAYYRGPGQDDIEAALGSDPEVITPPVANEDAAWEAIVDFHERMQRLLRVVTAELTSGLDEE